MVKAKNVLLNVGLGLTSLPALALYHMIKSCKTSDFDFNEEGEWVNRAEEGRRFLSKWAHRIVGNELYPMSAVVLSAIGSISSLYYSTRDMREFESGSVHITHFMDYGNIEDYNRLWLKTSFASDALGASTNYIFWRCLFDPPENERTRVVIEGKNGSDEYSFTSYLGEVRAS